MLPQDDMVLALAVTARCDYIATFNQRDFQGVEKFALQASSLSITLFSAILNLKPIARTRVAQTVSLRLPGAEFPAAAPQINGLRYSSAVIFQPGKPSFSPN
jgi:hypothetical protein